MTKNISFALLAGRWFAVIPDYDDGDVDDLEMVGGAKDMLDIMYGNQHKHDGIVSMQISDSEPDDWTGIELTATDDGAKFDGEMGTTYRMKDNNGILPEMDVWLCPVCRWFFMGMYPKKIYINIL